MVAGYRGSILQFRGRLIGEFQKKGFEVHIAAPGLTPSYQQIDQLHAAGVIPHDLSLRRADTNLLRDLAAFAQLLLLIIRISPDCCLTYTVKPNIYGVLAAWLCRVPKRIALVTGLGFVFTGARRGVTFWLVRRMYAFALRKTQLVFFQNRDDQARFREENLLGPDTRSLVVNGSGVDLDEYAYTRPADEFAGFLMIARLLGDKGVREYAMAACEIRKSNPAIQFSLVGWIDENPDAISLSELDDWIDQGCIEFLGRLDDVRPAIAAASVYVLPSYREGTPRTVLEAMSMGRAIITTDAPGCRETVVDGENGYLVPTHSVDGLVSAMQKFIDDPTLARTMGQRSREIAEEKYDVHKVNALMLREMGIT